MAESEQAATNAETAASTPNSTGGDAQNQTKAPKDRQCPFCDQPFTSSSLGRHLDLYIRPKNPKPPDGIHDVEEIRKLRGGITRRQPRTSTRTAGSAGGVNSNAHSRQGSTCVAHNTSIEATRSDGHAHEDTPVNSPINAKGSQESSTIKGFNKANWQATGVINNLPPRTSSRNTNDHSSRSSGQAQRVHEVRRDDAGSRIQRPEYENESMWKLQEAAELGRAAEMALREVLGSLEAASRKVEPKLLFEDFDFYAASFPGLCLAILPAPSTLFSPTPFPSAESWTLGPPGFRQFETMSRFVNERATLRRRTEHIPDSVLFKHHSHLSGAWEHWETMSETDRSSAWHLEILRSFTRGQDRISRLRSDLEQAQQRNRHLEAEYDRLSRCQLPREYLMHPPNTLPVSTAVMKEVKSNQARTAAAEADYDADALLSKWRATIRATARRPAAQPSSLSIQQPSYSEGYKNHLRDDIVMNGAIWNVGGPLPREANPNPEAVHDHPSVLYQTPPNPGAVVGADDDEPTTAEAEVDGDRSIDDRGGSRYEETGALVKRRRLNPESPRKRPLPGGSAAGTRGARILKEHFSEAEGASHS